MIKFKRFTSNLYIYLNPLHCVSIEPHYNNSEVTIVHTDNGKSFCIEGSLDSVAKKINEALEEL